MAHLFRRSGHQSGRIKPFFHLLVMRPEPGTPAHPDPRTRFSRTWWLLMAAVAALSALLFLGQLGRTGLVDETPPLFATAARNMVESGDWLTPRVNGMPRFDKPILVYWLMGLGYRLLPPSLDPLGSQAARLPSVLSATVVCLALADVLWWWPQQQEGIGSNRGGRWLAPLTASLGFGLSPLVLAFSRTAGSDLLLTGLLSLSLLGFWRHWARGSHRLPVGPWLALGLAVLAKGPVALVLACLTCLLFGCRQRKLGLLWRCLSPLKGLVLVALVALPWHVAEFAAEGWAFIQIFFGYHNIQRFAQVVNGHSGPFWFYGPILLIGAMPQWPMALHGLWIGLKRPHGRTTPQACPPQASLRCFAACWLLAVVAFLTMAATKLPSYILPAMPAVGLLVGLTAGDWQRETTRGRSWAAAWTSVVLSAVVGAGLCAQALWLPQLDQALAQAFPDMPTLQAELQALPIIANIGLIWLIAAGLTTLALHQRWWGWLLTLQLVLVLWIPLGLLPLGSLVDHLRQEPLRVIATVIQDESRSGEPLAMAGFNKPSLHFYAKRLVRYGSRSAQDLANLVFCTDRGSTADTMLVVLDEQTAAQPHWRVLQGTTMAQAGVYELRRLERPELETVVNQLQRDGIVQRDCP